MSKLIKTVRGMRDFLPEEKAKLDHVINVVRNLFEKYGYDEVSMPIVENFELLAMKAGEDIRKRMFVFEDKGGRTVALRPEMTPSVARLFIDSLMKAVPKPVKLGYIGPCFRYEEPQMGRYREFWQGGFEVFGSPHPEADAEILAIAHDMMTSLGFEKFQLRLGHVGIIRSILKQEGIEEDYQDRIMGMIDADKKTEVFGLLAELDTSEKCMKSLTQLLKIKDEDLKGGLKKAQEIVGDFPNTRKAMKNLHQIVEITEAQGIIGKIQLDLSLARGLEYYTGMIFEIFARKLPIAIGGGGRYDKLVELFGGVPTPAVGFSPGLDRIALAMDKEGLFADLSKRNKVLVVPASEDVYSHAAGVVQELRRQNIPCELELMRRSLKRSLSFASNSNYDYVVIVGKREMEKGEITVKNLKTGEQKTVSIDKAHKEIPNVSRKNTGE
ncbi:MAG: histidine--tRNA ligase [Candidatus Hodarchaeota archaeon]